MQKNEVFHVNYYLGPMISLAGDLLVEGQQIVFRPTGPIERAMGARDVVIPIDQIVIFESVGGLSRTVRIKAVDKIYKFEGSDALRFGEWLLSKLPTKAYRSAPVKLLHPRISPKYACPQCTEILQPGLRFCTHCGARPSPICKGCQRLIDTNWTCCGYCGAKISLPADQRLS